MYYIEITIRQLNGFDPGIIVANLAESGFDSFTEIDDGIQAYANSENYLEKETMLYLNGLQQSTGIAFSVTRVEPENWNARWESEYEPVTVDGICRIRAPFHPPDSSFQFDLVIEPKMSFGTAHHETTELMIRLMLKEEIEGKSVLDMGCGTGVLAILAAMKKAASVVAIDTDDWAFENAIENKDRNGVGGIKVIKGDAGSIPGEMYHLVAANINRNVLLNDMEKYVHHLEKDGTLLMSGFYFEDLDAIHRKARESGLTLIGYSINNNWVGVKFVK